MAEQERSPICGATPTGQPQYVVKMAELMRELTYKSDSKLDRRTYAVRRFVDVAGHKWEASWDYVREMVGG